MPKLGLRWQPFDDQLTIRATWGQGFREPSLEELFSAPISESICIRRNSSAAGLPAICSAACESFSDASSSASALMMRARF